MPQTGPFDLKRGFPAWLGALVGFGAGVVYGLAGFFLLKMSEGPRMGQVLFLMLPFLAGATIAMVTPRGFSSAALLSATFSLLICLLSLIAMHAEGILCAVLAFPLIFLPLALGVAIGTLLRNMIRPFEKVATNCIVLLGAPLLLFAGHRLEVKTFKEARTQSITTTITWPQRPNRCGRISSRWTSWPGESRSSCISDCPYHGNACSLAGLWEASESAISIKDRLKNQCSNGIRRAE